MSFWQLFSSLPGQIFRSFVNIAYVAPFFLPVIIWRTFIYWRRALWISKLKRFTAEIKIPKNIDKTPAAMEAVLMTLAQTSQGALWKEQILQGRQRSWFSLEIASIGGEVKFFINGEEKYRNLLEAQIYANYPDVEIVYGDDYSRKIPYGLPGSDWSMWGISFKLTSADALPIKTYIDYGVDQNIEDFKKVDPLVPILEGMGSIGPYEQFWYQIIIRATHKDGKTKGLKNWQEEGRELINKIMKRDSATATTAILSPGEIKKIEAIERSIKKVGFDAHIRMLYFAKGDHFDGKNIAFLLSCMRHLNSGDLNNLGVSETTSTDYWYQEYFGSPAALYKFTPTGDWSDRLKKKYVDAYRRRLAFHPPHVFPSYVLNTEELATLYHFPGQVAKTPSLSRIESKRSDAPSNLPI
jgi:hypothetical protein